MVNGNNMIPNGHFHKNMNVIPIRLGFNRAANKLKRRQKRRMKMCNRGALSGPALKLRPIVQCGSAKYNLKSRKGRGFTLAELKAAKMSFGYARTVGISVDRRRRNKCARVVQRNAQRLKLYKQLLIVFRKNQN